MIEMSHLTPNDIGRWVDYTPSHGDVERGRIKSFNDCCVWVVYHCDNNWDCYKDYTAASTRPEDLTFYPDLFDECINNVVKDLGGE